jgi:anti-sigma regulatory factor (Ser/Thr protein kinase)
LQQSQKSIAIFDRSSIGEARRIAMSTAEDLGFDQERRSNIGIVVTEAASNILAHARFGEFLICPSLLPNAGWLDLIALDNGPGILDVQRAMQDGFSTRGSAGQGLGAINRLADQTAIYTLPDRGAALWARFNLRNAPSAIACINVPLIGESFCGDGYLIAPGPNRSLFMVVDGLGHGAAAQEAATEAVFTVINSAENSPSEIIFAAHTALKRTRGAAMSVATVNHSKLSITYAGVGNVSTSLSSVSGSRNLASQNGTLGAVMPHVREYIYPYLPNTILLMFSDGLHSRGSFSAYPGLVQRPPAIIAGVIYRDFTRKRDDATIMVARLEGDSQ